MSKTYTDLKIIRMISTRKFEGDDPVQTQLTLDCSGLDEADIIEYAAQKLVIKVQDTKLRKLNTPIPAVYTYKVPKPGARTMVVDYHAALVKGLGEERATAMVKKYGSAEEAWARVKAALSILEEETE